MADTLLPSTLALIALIPAALLAYSGRAVRDLLFFGLMALAAAGPLAFSSWQLQETWNSGLAVSLWLSIGVTLCLYLIVAGLDRTAVRLAPVLLSYVLVLAALAYAAGALPAPPASGSEVSAWLPAHVGVALVAYGLIALAAVAAAAVSLQERSLKLKRPSLLSSRLPPVAEAEALQRALLIAGEAVLGAGLVTGMAVEYAHEAQLLRFDHKTLLVVATFVINGILIYIHFRSGLRGRLAARWVLVAYLLLVLGYSGVKFVTEAVLA